MSGTLRLRGATSGYSELQAPAVAADQTFILPTAGGTLLTTDSPISKLTLELGSASQPSLTFEGDTDTGLYSSGTNTLNLVTGGNNRLNIDSSGRVGLNTTSPTKTLDVNGTFRVVNESVFDADVIVYGDAQLNQQGIKFGSGLITAVQTYGGNSVFRGHTTAGGNYNIDLKASGDASFLGDVGIGASNNSSYDSIAQNLLVADESGNTGITIRSGGSTPFGAIHFADGTASNAEKRAGRIIYQHAINTLSFSTADTERMRIDSSGKVGIGCTPVRDLQLHTSDASSELMLSNSTTGATAGSGFMIQQDGNDNYIWNKENSFMSFGTNALERLRIDSSGNVGIGTSSPIAKLDVRGTVYIGTSLGIDISNPGDYHASANDLVMNGGMTLANTSQGSIFFADSATGTGEYVGQLNYYHSSDSMAFVTNNGERMRILSDGRVSIGTIAPPAGADFTIRAPNPELSLYATANYSSYLMMGDTDDYANGYIEYDNYDPNKCMKFFTNAGERMRINSNGNVGIGTSSPLVSHGNGLHIASTNAGLKLQNTTNTGWAYVEFTDESNTTKYIQGYRDSTELYAIRPGDSLASTSGLTLDSSGNLLVGTATLDSRGVRIYSSGTNGLYVKTTSTCQYWITNDGQGTGAGTIATIYNDTTVAGSITVNSNTTAYNTGSDYRLKENVVNIIDGITRVKQLSPKRFNFIIDADRTVDGFLAHEAQTVVPEAVTGEKDGDEMQCIDQSKLVPLLTAALQEAIAKIETLEVEVAALKAG